jgi:voltage-gated potassium channel Kch
MGDISHAAVRPVGQHSADGVIAFIYRWLFDHEFAPGFHRQVERAIALLILISVAAIVLEHIPEIYLPHAQSFHWFDVITVAIFSVEYLLRLYTAPVHPEFAGHRFPRLRYAFSFYALVDLVAILPFYFSQFFTVDVEMLRVLRLLRLMRIFKLSRELVPAWTEFQSLNAGRSFRAKLYALLEPTGHSGRLHIFVDNFIVFWIALSIVCVVLESVDSIQHLFAAQFAWIDVIAFTIFTVEYLARVYTAPENPDFRDRYLPRWAHVRSGQAIIDLLTILPFLLERFLPFDLDLRFLRVFRLLRMLKLTRYTSATTTLLKVIGREWQIILASVFVMLLLVVLTASLGYLFEHDAQPDKFENIPQSIYWAVVTLASVGYGDISPVTPMGRALTVVLALVGIGIFAIPAGLLASAFTDQLRIDRESFRHLLQQAYADGAINLKEKEEIVAEAERLHLSDQEFNRLLVEAKAEFDKSMTEQELSFGQLMLDANAHPEFAAEQFRILVAQQSLLLKATGVHLMQDKLAKSDNPDELTHRVMQTIADYQKSRSAND